MEEKKLYNAVQKFITLADGREIMIETGKLAKQADGSVVVKQGDTMLLATVVAAKDAKPDTDFMPLQVEYKEKYAACGRYPGGFMKREGKANDSEVLVARLIDRALRPLFPSDYHAEVYVTVNLISADKDTRNNKGLMVNQKFESDNHSTPKFEMSELPQEIGKMVYTMQVGDISKPFTMINDKQKEIVAIVKLKARVDQHKANISDDYQALKSIVESRKREELLHDWIIKKQKSTYVRISDGWRNCDFQYPGWVKE